MKKFYRAVFALFLLILIIPGLFGCKRQDNISDSIPIKRDGFFLDTVISVSIYGMDAKEAGQSIDDCFSLAKHYEDLLSKTIETSDISKINSSAPNPVEVSPDTVEVIEKGLEYSKLSDGSFDITMGNVTNLWDFHSDTPTLPDLNIVAENVSYVDFNKVSISGNTVCLKESNVSIDLGGIAKGFIADKMKEKLLENGVTSAFINLGGNVLTIGTKPDGSPIRVGIQNPNAEESAPILTLEDTKDLSIVTSGTYQRYFEVDGIRYHHILSSDNGMPIQNDLASVTIISPSSTDCDALSTTCFILGKKEAEKLLSKFPGIKAIFIYKDGTISEYQALWGQVLWGQVLSATRLSLVDLFQCRRGSLGARYKMFRPLPLDSFPNIL